MIRGWCLYGVDTTSTRCVFGRVSERRGASACFSCDEAVLRTSAFIARCRAAASCHTRTRYGLVVTSYEYFVRPQEPATAPTKGVVLAPAQWAGLAGRSREPDPAAAATTAASINKHLPDPSRKCLVLAQRLLLFLRCVSSFRFSFRFLVPPADSRRPPATPRVEATGRARGVADPGPLLRTAPPITHLGDVVASYQSRQRRTTRRRRRDGTASARARRTVVTTTSRRQLHGPQPARPPGPDSRDADSPRRTVRVRRRRCRRPRLDKGAPATPRLRPARR